MSRILVEREDLSQAIRQYDQLISRLQQHKQHMKSVYDRLGDWRGQSADELRSRMEAFFQGIAARIQEIEAQKSELIRYLSRMEAADMQR